MQPPQRAGHQRRGGTLRRGSLAPPPLAIAAWANDLPRYCDVEGGWPECGTDRRGGNALLQAEAFAFCASPSSPTPTTPPRSRRPRPCRRRRRRRKLCAPPLSRARRSAGARARRRGGGEQREQHRQTRRRRGAREAPEACPGLRPRGSDVAGKLLSCIICVCFSFCGGCKQRAAGAAGSGSPRDGERLHGAVAADRLPEGPRRHWRRGRGRRRRRR